MYWSSRRMVHLGQGVCPHLRVRSCPRMIPRVFGARQMASRMLPSGPVPRVAKVSVVISPWCAKAAIPLLLQLQHLGANSGASGCTQGRRFPRPGSAGSSLRRSSFFFALPVASGTPSVGGAGVPFPAPASSFELPDDPDEDCDAVMVRRKLSQYNWQFHNLPRSQRCGLVWSVSPSQRSRTPPVPPLLG
jgi:hypothetical protein